MLEGLEDEQLTQGSGDGELNQLLQSVRMSLQKLDGIHQLEFARIGGMDDGDVG